MSRRAFNKFGKVAFSAALFSASASQFKGRTRTSSRTYTPAQLEAKDKADGERRQFYDNTRLASSMDHGKTSVTEDKVRELPIVDRRLKHVHHLDVEKPMQVASVVVQADMKPAEFDQHLAPQIQAEGLRQMEQYIARRDLVTKAAQNGDFDTVRQNMFPPVHEPTLRVSNNAGGQMVQEWIVSNPTVAMTPQWISAVTAKHNLDAKSVEHLRNLNGTIGFKVDILSTGDSAPSDKAASVAYKSRAELRVVGGYENDEDVQTALSSRSNSRVIAAPRRVLNKPLTTTDAAARTIVTHTATSEVADAIKGLDIQNPKTQKFQVQVGKTFAKQWASASPEWVAKQVMDASIAV